MPASIVAIVGLRVEARPTELVDLVGWVQIEVAGPAPAERHVEQPPPCARICHESEAY